eukprot:s2780_g11.t1
MYLQISQEFDHRVALGDMSAVTTSSKVTLESGRDLATVAYDLAAFVGHEGPYTLHEIYQAFSFCDTGLLLRNLN